MAITLQTTQILVGIAVGALTALGVVFGWLGRSWRWVRARFRDTAVIDIPRRSVILVPAALPGGRWWHMRTLGVRPAMQIAGYLNVTNISKYDVRLMGAKLRKPKAVGW